MVPEDMEKWFFRNSKGEMVPFSSFASAHWEYAPARLERYNGVPSVEILGQPAPGVSSGTAMLEMEKLAGQLPQGIGYEWTGLSYQERLSGSQAPALFALSILVVFLCLAALYESWSVPFAVILVVPLGVLGALGAANMRMLSNDVYFQAVSYTPLHHFLTLQEPVHAAPVAHHQPCLRPGHLFLWREARLVVRGVMAECILSVLGKGEPRYCLQPQRPCENTLSCDGGRILE